MNSTNFDIITTNASFRVLVRDKVFRNDLYMNIMKSLLMEEFKFDDSNIRIDLDRLEIALSKRKKGRISDNPFYSINGVLYKFFTNPEVSTYIRQCIAASNLLESVKQDLYIYLNMIIAGDNTSISLLYTISVPTMNSVNLIL